MAIRDDALLPDGHKPIPGFPALFNFRDLGGYPTQDGRRIKRGLIYRSGGLTLLNEEELERFKSFGIHYIMDLRTTKEIERKPDPPLEGVEFMHYSGLEFRGGEEIDFSPEGMHRLGDGAQDQYEKFTAYYHEMPFDNEAFRIIMEALEAHKTPFLFHCASGKDRTGVAAMIILLALGVSREFVFADYALSNLYLEKEVAEMLESSAAEVEGDTVAQQLRKMEAGVHLPLGLGVLQEFLRRYDSIEDYLEAEYGLAGQRLERFRDFYLEG